MPHRHRILVVEDDPTCGPAVVREFTHQGMTCALATTLGDGLRMAMETHFSCVILDAGLPDGDVEGEYGAIDRIPEFETRVVVYTGSGDPDLFRAVRKHGAPCVEKGPDSMAFLVHAVWSEINYEDGDHESAVAQQVAQRRVTAPAPKDFAARRGPLIFLAIAILTFTATLGGWMVHTIVAETRKEEASAHRFELVEKRLDAKDKADEKRDRADEKRDEQISLIMRQNQISIDDRAALRATALEWKRDFQSWMERIEAKMERIKSATFFPEPPTIVKSP